MKTISNNFYNINDLLSYGEVFNEVSGQRGRGKTYAALKHAVTHFKKTGQKFCLVRRYKEEAQQAKKNLGSDINLNTNLDIRVSDNYRFFCGDKHCGEIIVLAKSITQKSVARPDYDTIIFDEYAIDNPSYHYIGGLSEPELLLNIFESVLRPREGNDKGKLILLANCVTFANPYYLYFNILPWSGRFYHNKEKSIVCEHDFNEAFAKGKKNTRFGKLIGGTRYEAYSVNADYIKDNHNFIEKKTGKCIPVCSLFYGGNILQFWRNTDTDIIYTNRGEPLTDHYSLMKDDMSTNTKLVQNYRYSPLREVVDAFKFGDLRFDGILTKSIALLMLNFFLK